MQAIKIMLQDADFGFVLITRAANGGDVIGIFATAYYWYYWFNGDCLNVMALEVTQEPQSAGIERAAIFEALRKAVEEHCQQIPKRIVGYFF